MSSGSGPTARPGAWWTGSGVAFAVHAPYAEEVELCLFTEAGEERHVLSHRAGDLHHGFVGSVGPGLRYGYRAHGLWDPGAGIFTNPAKLLLDPYARAVAGDLVANPSLVIHRPRAEDRPDERDSAGFVPRSIVVDPTFDWSTDRPPRTPWDRTVIYETHVRGLTMRHPAVAPDVRGTYAGLTTEPVVEHLLALGVTAIELLPVQASFTEPWLSRRDLRNYWGYATGGFFAPNPWYSATSDPVNEFKQMVRALHEHGLEVILDVAYNHTCEGNHQGAVVSFRGLDNPGFYRLDPLDRRRYIDWTGTGNTVDLNSPWALSVVMDSLRYWVEEMHVDGFRFDLATTLGRAPIDFRQRAPFFLAVHQDPVLRSVKLIAEPWDLGPGGYQVGAFPTEWAEWNGRYRDDVRDFWRGNGGLIANVATRLTGSSDLYADRGPLRSVNFITSHDGFTLVDLVSYDHKHNHANREHNHDGESHNRSWNSGVEGPSDDAAVSALRRRRARSLLATLFLSQGVPMLLGGDELGRSQGGNNNAYCQDNEVSWYDWEAMDWGLIGFVQRLVSLRRENPVLRRSRFPAGAVGEGGHRDISWFTPSGQEMTENDWNAGFARTVAVLLTGEDGDLFYLMLNAGTGALSFTLPQGAWSLELATGEAVIEDGRISLEDFSLALVRSRGER
jgi:glycogen operon protein